MNKVNTVGYTLSRMIIIKNIVLVLVMLSSVFISSQALAGPAYKLKITNAMHDGLKVKWYCDGKKKDADTYPPFKTQTRQLAQSKCPNINDLTFKVYSGTYGFRLAMNGYLSSDAYANIVHFDIKDLDKSFMKSSLLSEIKYSKIDTSSNSGMKRCIAVAPDSFWAAIFGPGSLITPAFYAKKC